MGRPPAFHIERFAAARAQGKNMADSCRLAGYPRDKSEVGARHAGERMAKHPEVREATERHKRDLIREAAKKQIADLWPDVLHMVELLLRDRSLNHSNQIKLAELVARMTGHLNSDTGVAVQVVQVGAEAREEIRRLQSDSEAQRIVLNELERLTRPGIRGSSGPPEAKKSNTDDSEPAVLTRPVVTLENGV